MVMGRNVKPKHLAAEGGIVEFLWPTFPVALDSETPAGGLQLVEVDPAAPVAANQFSGWPTVPCNNHALALAGGGDQFGEARFRIADRNFHGGSLQVRGSLSPVCRDGLCQSRPSRDYNASIPRVLPQAASPALLGHRDPVLTKTE